MNKILNKFITILLLFSLVIGNMSNLASSLKVAHADSVFDYTGTEDAETLEDFNGDYSAMCLYKIWSTCKSLGMSDEQACGILGCFSHEGQPESVETFMGYATDDMDALADYIEEHCKPFQENSTEVTKEALRNYGSKYYDSATLEKMITDGQNEIGSSMQFDDKGNTLNPANYFENGVGYCGVGITGFTASRCKLLLEFSEDNNCDWWVMETQLTFCLIPTEDGGDERAHVWKNYITDTAGYSVDECTEYWIEYFVNGGMSDNMRSARKTSANNFYTKLRNKGWDEDYGAMIVSGAGLRPSSMHDGINDKGIIQSYANSVLYYPQNTGYLLDDAKTEELQQKNVDVYRGFLKHLQGMDDNSTKYSLFELYGEDVRWYRYMGELTYSPSLLDHIWCAIDQKKVDKLISFDTIDYEAPVYLSCQVYNERPVVLTSTDIDNGYKDPRAKYQYFNGYGYVLGSFYMTCAKYINATMTALMDDTLTNAIFDVFDKIESETADSKIWEGIRVIILVLLGLSMVFFIISLVGKGIKYAKGQGSPKEAIERFLIGFCCLGLLMATVYNPKIFNNVIRNTLNVVDDFFQASLAESKQIQNDEVICVSDPDYVMQAAIWKTGIFNAWCRGQFDGLEYEQLYTNYSKEGAEEGKGFMPQSNDTPDPSDTKGEPVFNSSEAVGDVYVYVGGGTEIRNWAAYLYSCGTPYHVDFTVDSTFAQQYAPEDIDTINVTFPMAKTCASNSLLYADTFRVVDAQMNIGPQLFPDGSKTDNYTDAHKLKTHFIAQGTVMLFNSALLLFFLPVIWQKIKNFVLMIITPFQIIWFSLLELFKEDSNLKNFTDTFIKAFFGYFTASLKINIMIMFYIIFVDKGLLMTVMFMLLSLVVLGFNVQDAKTFVRNTKANVQRIKNSF